MRDNSFQIRAIDTFPLRAEIATPRRNAFGVMTHRPGLLVRVTLTDGAIGWGEVFANWPAFGNLHRKRIVDDVLRPLATSQSFPDVSSMYRTLSDATASLALQCGEPGPFAQSIAGLDVAVWDALSRRAEVPLYAYLARNDRDDVPLHAYASGLSPETIEKLAPSIAKRGWKAFKLKVGFGEENDTDAIKRLRHLIGENCDLMTDANQKWDLSTALHMVDKLSDMGVYWVEEPISAAAPFEAWRELCENARIAIAAGENVRGHPAFQDLARSGVTFLQPDLIKWGGVTAVVDLISEIERNGTEIAPHYLGGAVGLAATAHVAKGCGLEWLEFDVTENPLRDELVGKALRVVDGQVDLTVATEPGHGVTPTDAFLETYAA